MPLKAKDPKDEVLTGFGVERTVKEWAEDLDMKTSLLLYLVKQEGMTVEEVYEFRGFKYTPPKKRKRRISEAMQRTLDRMRTLLEMSGYSEEATDTLEVKRVGNNGHHAIFCEGELLGVYAYRTGGLKLSGGQGIPLMDMEWEDAKVCKNEKGLWDPHPDTHALMVKRAIRQDTKITVEEHERTIVENEGRAHIMYEGFGKQYTCTTWASVLRIPKTTLWRKLKKGYTIEDIAKERGIEKV